MSNTNELVTGYMVEAVRAMKEMGATTEQTVAGVVAGTPIARATVEAVASFVETEDAEALAAALDAIPFPVRKAPTPARTSG